MPDVFLSYRRENDAHMGRVRAFAAKLEGAGIDVIFDEFADEREFHGGGPDDSWALWSTAHAEEAKSVLVVASAGWFAALKTKPVDKGKGAAAEAITVFHRLYDGAMRSDFLRIGFFDQQDLAELPHRLAGPARFDLFDEQQVAKLVQWLGRFDKGTAGREPPRQLPAPPEKGFFGRVEQRRELLARLQAGKNTAVVGPAGYGKTALAAVTLREIVGDHAERLADSPFPDGIVNLDLYRHHGQVEPAWHEIADRLAGDDFLPQSPGRDRAAAACRGRRLLLVIEGGEECGLAIRESTAARGAKDDPLLSVLDEPNRWLLLTRDARQATAAETVRLRDVLADDEAAELFDSLTGGRVTGAPRDRVLKLLDGHPLALTWAGGLLGWEDEDPAVLADDWERDPLLRLTDPQQVEHTLAWLFGRSVRGLDETARRMLDAAGLLGRAPFPAEALERAVAAGGGQALQNSFLPSAKMNFEVPDPVPRESLKRLLHLGLLRLAPDDHREFTHVLGYRFARNETSSDPELRRRLAEWLHERLAALLRVSDFKSEISNLQSALPDLLQHVAGLLRADYDQQLWRPLAEFVLYDARKRLVALGRLDLVHTSLHAVSAWLDRFPVDKAVEAFWQRERSVCLNRLGDLATAQGNLPEAQRLFGESLRIAQRLAESDPANAAWQRDLAQSHCWVGMIQQQQGDLTAAKSSFERYRDVMQCLAESDPANAAWQRDLSVSFIKLGDLATAQGNLPEAQRLFGEDLRIAQRLADSDPANAAWQRDLSVSFNKLGDLATAQGNLPEAQRLFGESLRIAQRLAESDPANAEWQRDLSVSFGKLGDLATAQGNLPEAQRLFGEALRIAQRLAESDPANAEWQRDLSVSFEKLGDLATAQGNLPEAQRLFGEALRIAQRLAESDPANAAWQRDLSVSFNKLGELATAQGNLPEAQRLFGESLRIAQRLAESDPANAAWQRDLSVSFEKLGDLATAQGNLPEAQRLFGESLRIRQRLAESDPANAAWQRDLWVSNWRVANVLEQLGSREALASWRRAHDTLARLVEIGLFVSPQDMVILDQLRRKAGL